MRSFFKIFFASFLSILVFALIVFFLLVAFVSNLVSKDKPEVSAKSVLFLNLGQQFHERLRSEPFSNFSDEGDAPGLFDVIRLINHAKTDDKISGIYIEANGNANGFASSNELRN